MCLRLLGETSQSSSSTTSLTSFTSLQLTSLTSSQFTSFASSQFTSFTSSQLTSFTSSQLTSSLLTSFTPSNFTSSLFTSSPFTSSERILTFAWKCFMRWEMGVKKLVHLMDIVADVPLIQYFHIGVVSLVISASIRRIVFALQNTAQTGDDVKSTREIFDALSAQQFFLFDALAVACALAALVLILRNGRFCHYVYLPLLLHYAFISTATHSSIPEWRVTSPPLRDNAAYVAPQTAPSPTSLLLRFEFLRAENRVQLWAYTVESASLKFARNHARKRRQINAHTSKRATRRGRRRRDAHYRDDDDASDYLLDERGAPFAACPALANPPSADDFAARDDAQSAQFGSAPRGNSVQLILDGAPTNCYYFLQVNAVERRRNPPPPVTDTDAPITSARERVWISVRGVAFLAAFVTTCALLKCVWRAFFGARSTRHHHQYHHQHCHHRNGDDNALEDARRFEAKLRQCTSLFSIETTLADASPTASTGASSTASDVTADEMLEPYHGGPHFSEVV